jgi:NADH:ubiquinone reductase (H+-translocating)
MTRPRVVIVGAGFGGLAAARALRKAPVDVTIVDRRNHHLFQPLLYQVATAGLSPADIAAPIRSIVRTYANTRVLLDSVEGVDTRRRFVRLGSGGTLDYDWLLIATGARHSYFGRDEWAEHAPGIKTIEDATAVRRKVLLALERAETEEDPERRKALLTFVVIGGGPTGVEMAGAIAELAHRSVSREFRSITPHCSRVVLIEGGDRLLPSFPEALSAKAKVAIEQLGVEVRLNAQVTDIDSRAVHFGGESISTHTAVWAAGVEASPAAKWLQAECDRAGRVLVGPDLRVPGCGNVFAVGDTASCPSPNGRPVPGVAPVAKQQGQYFSATIVAALGGRPAPRPFRYRSFGNLATIGRRRAVIDFGRIHLSGFPAWLLWSVAHIWFLIGFRSRITVSLSWLWNYLTFERGARLITGDIAPEPRRPIPLDVAA